MVAFIFGLTIGLIVGVLFQHWWMTPDIRQLKARIVVLEDERRRLTKQILKDFRISVIRGVDREDDA